MRIVVIAILLAANALVWAWGQGHLASLGWPSTRSAAAPQPTTNNRTTVTHSIEGTTDKAASSAPGPIPATPVSSAVVEPAVQTTIASTTNPAASDAVTTTGLAEQTPDQVVVPTDAPLSNKALFKGTASAVCWRARTWPVEGKEALQRALSAAPADVLWRIVPHELAQRWVLLVVAGNTSLEQRKQLLRKNQIEFRDSEAPLPNGLIVATFVARDSALAMLDDLRRKRIPAEVMQERPATPVWEVNVFANKRADVDTLLERVKDIPRYADSPLRVGRCESSR
ncbi:hypothetical protein LN050_08415 [Comamonadaceae bacterium M7527]|nr:hypothetical protein LN050_08415 [Comamonadaceae bacterium M7527]